MPKSKVFDQLLLLLAGIAMSIAGFWFWSFVEHRGISNKMSFFIFFNIGEGFVLTWQAIASFRNTRGFWLMYGCWALAHTIAYVAWGYSGHRIELCVVVLPLEHYLYYRVARYRFRRGLAVASQPGGR